MPYPAKDFIEIYKGMIQILLMLEVLFTQDSEVVDLFPGASFGSEPSLFFSHHFFGLGFKPVQNDCQHKFARVTDKVIIRRFCRVLVSDSSYVLPVICLLPVMTH